MKVSTWMQLRPSKTVTQQVKQIPYPEIASLSILIAYNAMNWSGSVALYPLVLASPLTYAVYPWFVHCKCGIKQNYWRILTIFIFWGIRK